MIKTALAKTPTFSFKSWSKPDVFCEPWHWSDLNFNWSRSCKITSRAMGYRGLFHNLHTSYKWFYELAIQTQELLILGSKNWEYVSLVDYYSTCYGVLILNYEFNRGVYPVDENRNVLPSFKWRHLMLGKKMGTFISSATRNESISHTSFRVWFLCAMAFHLSLSTF